MMILPPTLTHLLVNINPFRMAQSIPQAARNIRRVVENISTAEQLTDEEVAARQEQKPRLNPLSRFRKRSLLQQRNDRGRHLDVEI